MPNSADQPRDNSSAAILLHLNQQTWEKTFDAINDCIAILDRNFRFVKVNKSFADFLKRKPEELIGLKCHEVVHGLQNHWPECPHAKMLAQGCAVTSEINDPHLGVPLLVTASPIFDERGQLLGSFHIAKDISLLKQTERALEVKNHELAILWDLSRQALRSQTLDDVVTLSVKSIMAAFQPDMVLFYVKQEEWLILKSVSPFSEEHATKQRERVGECLCGLAAEHGRPVYSGDLHADVRCTHKECKNAGLVSFAALPLIYNEEIIGVFGIASRVPRDFSMQKEFLEIFSATVAIMVKNALMLDEIRRHSADLEVKIAARTRELEERTVALEDQKEELERFNKLFVDREIRMIELKERITALEKKLQNMNSGDGQLIDRQEKMA